MLDWRERDRARCTLGRPASCDYATRSDFMLIGSLPLLLPSSSSPKLSLLLSTFVFASLLYFWFASSSECTPMWPVKINTIDQTKLPNCWQVSVFFSLLRSCEVDECCPLVVETHHIQSLLYSNPSFFLSKSQASNVGFEGCGTRVAACILDKEDGEIRSCCCLHRQPKRLMKEKSLASLTNQISWGTSTSC